MGPKLVSFCSTLLLKFCNPLSAKSELCHILLYNSTLYSSFQHTAYTYSIVFNLGLEYCKSQVRQDKIGGHISGQVRLGMIFQMSKVIGGIT